MEGLMVSNFSEHINQISCKAVDLINNAGIASNPKSDGSDFRQVYNQILDTNVTSIAVLTTRFLPLLELSDDPRVINISSARASVALQASGSLPPTASIPYSISKTAVNILTMELQKLHPSILFHAVSPGHCKTALNGFRGTKDPIDGAKVVVKLLNCERNAYASGFWQCEGDGLSPVQW
jgi:NAD(P)-dependent dehydrogenase (short-subunit alcohol dehydrogenase family)